MAAELPVEMCEVKSDRLLVLCAPFTARLFPHLHRCGPIEAARLFNATHGR